jgi:hypothetical protein
MYIAIPHELYDARNNNEITPSMYETMVWLHRRADWAKGNVRMVSAERISIEIGGMFKPRTIQDAMHNLEACGWITLHRAPGQHGSYWVGIHNFVALTGTQKDSILNPRETNSYKNSCPTECADSALKTALTVRRECADSAPILETTETTDFSDSIETTGKPNQSTNQSTNSTEASPPSLELNEEEKPYRFFDDGEEVWDYQRDVRLSPKEKEAWTREHLQACFRKLMNPSAEDLRLMYEVCLKCEGQCCFPESLVEYAQQHHTSEKTRGMVPRDVKHLWTAVCGPKVSPSNGLIAQFKDHPLDCRKCEHRKRNDAKRQEELTRSTV